MHDIISRLGLQTGMPKICVPLMGQTPTALLDEIRCDVAQAADLFEWRLDAFHGDALAALPAVKEAAADKPLLCTMRTKKEGGLGDLDAAAYGGLLQSLILTQLPDLIDIELSAGEDAVKPLVCAAHAAGIAVVMSKHDFAETPARHVLENTLYEMHGLGADLPKIAVMPQSVEDVLNLFAAANRAAEKNGPLIAIAMGELGKISRVCGGFFGSCITFAAGAAASAPGQVDAGALKAALHAVRQVTKGEKIL